MLSAMLMAIATVVTSGSVNDTSSTAKADNYTNAVPTFAAPPLASDRANRNNVMPSLPNKTLDNKIAPRPPHCPSDCPTNWLSDSLCDSVCNNVACLNDGGDCDTCVRPSYWCTHAGATYSATRDCDGDGILDPYCSDGTASGSLLSGSGCHDSWPTGTCPAPGTGVGCLGWKQTGGCSSQGPREPGNDKDCATTIDSEWSGFCDCGNGRKAMEKGCHPAQYSNCESACSSLYLLPSLSPPPPPTLVPCGGADVNFPDVDHGLVCDYCKVLVDDFQSYGSCDEYCKSIGRTCVSAAEEQHDDCKVEYTMGCEEDAGGFTSDALCECSPDWATSPSPPAPPPYAIRAEGAFYDSAICSDFSSAPGQPFFFSVSSPEDGGCSKEDGGAVVGARKTTCIDSKSISIQYYYPYDYDCTGNQVESINISVGECVLWPFRGWTGERSYLKIYQLEGCSDPFPWEIPVVVLSVVLLIVALVILYCCNKRNAPSTKPPPNDTVPVGLPAATA